MFLRPCETLFSLVVMLSVAFASGCNPPKAENSSLTIVCTTSQVGDLVRHVVGDHAKVVTIMGSGVDPHLYQANQKDRDEFNAADAIFYSGLHLEGKLSDQLSDWGKTKKTVAVTKVLVDNHADRLLQPAEFEGYYDPHVWFDPTLWAHCVQYVGEQMAEIDPEHKEEYLKNAKQYQAEILKEHDTWKTELASIPKERRVLVTAHDAFGYFGGVYGLEVRGLQGISTADETSVGTINNLVQLLVSKKIKAVFVESSVPPRRIQSLIQGCDAQGHQVVVGGEIFSDAMGPDGTDEAEYLGMVRHNVRTIVSALK